MRQGWGVRYPEAIQTEEVWVALEEQADAFNRKISFAKKGRNLVEIDMKFAIKGIVAAVAFVAAGAASAAAQTAVLNGADVGGLQIIGGAGKLSFSANLLAALDAGKIAVSSWAPGTAIGSKDEFGEYTEVSATAPIQSAVIDTASMKYMSVAVAGGATQTSVANKVTTGGSLTVGNLNVDLVNKKVFATVNGANGVGNNDNFYLFDITGPVVQDTFKAGLNQSLTTITGLKITQAGFDAFVKSLGLLPMASGALNTVTDYGTITTQISVRAVPEPSTYALMALGVAAVGVAARRRRAA